MLNTILSAALGLCLLALPATAGGTLEGRIVTLNVLTADAAGVVLFESRGRTVTVGPGVEFGMGPEHQGRDFDVVPVEVEIGPQRIAFSYGGEAGQFFDAAFNGYVLRFATDCALFEAVDIDRSATTMPVAIEDIRIAGGVLYVNVAGQHYGPTARLVLDFVVGECLLG